MKEVSYFQRIFQPFVSFNLNNSFVANKAVTGLNLQLKIFDTNQNIRVQDDVFRLNLKGGVRKELESPLVQRQSGTIRIFSSAYNFLRILRLISLITLTLILRLLLSL